MCVVLEINDLSQSAQAALTKHHRLGGLSHKNLFLMDLESGQSKVKMPASSVPGRSSLLGLQTAIFLLYSLKVVGVETE